MAEKEKNIMANQMQIDRPTMQKMGCCFAIIVGFFLPWMSGGLFGGNAPELMESLSKMSKMSSFMSGANDTDVSWFYQLAYGIPIFAGWHIFKGISGWHQRYNVQGMIIAGYTMFFLVVFVGPLLDAPKNNMFGMSIAGGIGIGAMVTGVSAALLFLFSLAGMLHTTVQAAGKIGGNGAGSKSRDSKKAIVNTASNESEGSKVEYAKAALTQASVAAESAGQAISKLANELPSKIGTLSWKPDGAGMYRILSWIDANGRAAFAVGIGVGIFASAFTIIFFVCVGVGFLALAATSVQRAPHIEVPAPTATKPAKQKKSSTKVVAEDKTEAVQHEEQIQS